MKAVALIASLLLAGSMVCMAQDAQSDQQQEKPGLVAQSGAAVGQTAAATAGTAVGGPLVGAVAGVVGGAVGGSVGKVVEGSGKKKQACDSKDDQDQKNCKDDQVAQRDDADQQKDDTR